jgi:integrase
MMQAEGWSRNYVNAQVGRLKRCFKWAVSQELVPYSVFHGLQSVAGLRRGKTTARETEPVKPVPEEWVRQTLPFVSRHVSGLIRLQLATGMRPGQAVIMRGCDLDTSGIVWLYRPARHKTQHHGHERTIYLGPQAQAVLSEFLAADLQAFLFSPAAAERERREALRERRRTPLSCGNRTGSNVKLDPERVAADRYTVASYRRAIANGCDLGGTDIHSSAVTNAAR